MLETMLLWAFLWTAIDANGTSHPFLTLASSQGVCENMRQALKSSTPTKPCFLIRVSENQKT